MDPRESSMNFESRKKYALHYAVALTALLTMAAAPSFGQLEGVWESVQRSEGGVGMTYEFRPDGNVCASPGAMVDFVYRHAGDKVAVLNADLTEEPETVMGFRLENGQLVVETGNPAPPLVRAHPEEAVEGSVTGVWKYVDTEASEEELGGTEAALIRRNTRIRFTSTGKALLRIPFRVDCSPYRIEGSTLHMERNGQPISPAFAVEENSLVLTARTGSKAEFTRLEH
jgi:hypothetical protein